MGIKDEAGRMEDLLSTIKMTVLAFNLDSGSET